jgi:hypothetical protein
VKQIKKCDVLKEQNTTINPLPSKSQQRENYQANKAIVCANMATKACNGIVKKGGY